ncbi:MAG: helix-turn-helix transcriptional regulator [Alistipes sp.]|nr:helix-turn-helix transcriptional regulator [Alistipes sp.]
MFAQSLGGIFIYNPQTTVDRIKSIRLASNISLSELNETCNLNKNTIATSANSKMGLSAKILFDISEQLACSVDYLLGRTDAPELNSCTSINQSNVNSDNSTVNVNTAAIDKDTLELVNMIRNLSIVQRAEIILKINEMQKQSY